MKAIVYCDYGLNSLKFQDIEKPVPNDDQLLVRVRAASVNPLDWHYIEEHALHHADRGSVYANRKTPGWVSITRARSKPWARM